MSDRTVLDGELLSCCAEALAIDKESNHLWAACRALPVDATGKEPAFVAYDAHEAVTRCRWHELVERICQVPARTPEELRAKTAVARAAVPFERREEPDPMDRLAWSVFDDVLGRAGA